MRAGLIVTGVLGIGTAAVFGLAAVASAAFPQGGTVSTVWNGAWNGVGIGIGKPMPMPIAVPAPGVIVIDNSNSGGASGPIDAPGGVVIGLPVTPSDAPPAK